MPKWLRFTGDLIKRWLSVSFSFIIFAAIVAFVWAGIRGSVQQHLSDYLSDHPFGYIGLLLRIDVDWSDRHHPSTDLRGYR